MNKEMLLKICNAVGLGCSVAVLVLSVLNLLGYGGATVFVLAPLIAVVLLCQGIRYWGPARKVAWFSFVCGGIVLVLTAVKCLFF